MTVKTQGFLSGNVLKIIAAIFMTVDHIGVVFYPLMSPTTYLVLRAIGRAAMPVFAFFIAEGCTHTRDITKYFITLFCFGAVCNVVFYFVQGTVYLCILTTFSLSVLLIITYKKFVEAIAEKSPDVFMRLTVFAAALSGVFLLSELIPKAGGIMDYGFAGAIMPLAVYLFKNKWLKLLGLAACILLACFNPIYRAFTFPVQWFAFVAVLLVALYNGERGKHKLKYFFYIFYPSHLVAIYAIAMIVSALL